MPQVDDDDDDLGAFLALAMSDMSKVASPKVAPPKVAAPPAMAVEASLDEFLATAATPEPPAAVEASIEEFLSSRESDPEPTEVTPVEAEPEGDDALSFLAHSGLKRVRDVPDIIKPWMAHHIFTQVKTLAEVNQIVDECIKRGFCSLDLETQGLDNRIYYDAEGKPQTVHKIVGFCISYDGIEGFYIPVRHRPTDGGPDLNVIPVSSVEQAISRLCHAAIPVGTPEAIETDPFSYEAPRPQVVIAMWNAQFDQEFLYPITGIDWWHPSSFEDGMLAAFTKWAGDKTLSLKKKAVQLLRDPDGNPYEMIELKELFDKGRKIQFDALAPDEPGVLRYAGSDAICTYKLCQIPDLVPLCLEKHAFTYRLEKQTTCTLRVMERNRVYITRDRVRETLREQEALRDALLQKIRGFAWEQKQVRLDPASPKQLGEFLFGTGPSGMGITPAPEKNEASGQYKTDGDTLEELSKAPNAPTILKEIVTYRELEKYIGTYLINLANNPDENSELRFCFKQTGAASGRLSAPSGDPEQGQSGVPVHGIPGGSEVRRNFEARKGYTMVKADYAGEELRIATNISNEPVWIKEFTYGTGDLHTITAQAFFGKQEVSKEERNAGKIANFSLLYGGGPKAIVRATGCDDMEARRRKQAFDKSVPVFAKWIKTQHEVVKRDLGVKTAYDRWLSIPDARHMDQAIRAACERHAVNYQIQGCIRGGTLVLTRNGYRKVSDLAQAGETFGAWTGTRWAAARAFSKGPWEAAELQLSDGTILACDTRHKLLVVTDEGYVWTDYADLTPDMRVATALCEPVEFVSEPLPAIRNEHNSHNHKPISIPLDESALWYWLGRYMGDGYLSEDGLCMTFGTHEMQAVADCASFWGSLGTNPSWKVVTHTPAEKEASRVVLNVYGKNLLSWLVSLGFERANAHTKRVPERAFRETLNNRKSFIRGMMDSDGCLSKTNSYHGIHLCQRPLLEDFKLLFRTIGVESKLCGPYTYTNKKTKLVTVSYRLNIQNRMYAQELGDPSGFKFAPNDMDAPQFLIDELLEQDPGTWGRKAFPDDSSYVLYRRIATGGRTTVYTLKKLCEMLGVTLSSPIYGIKTLVSKTALGREEDTYTLSVDDPLHRFDAEGIITKNSGADIMKIAMVTLHKAFHRKGWLRNGGDDSIRMLLTVHDEIVFEIKHARVAEAIPVIVALMEAPWKRPNKPKWTVPLVVEPLVGFNWASGYMVERAKPDHKLGKTEVLINGFIYHTTRKPKSKDDVIVESLDIQEVLEGKKFRVVDPPWLMGRVPGEQDPNSQEPSEPAIAEPVPSVASSQPVESQEIDSFVADLVADLPPTPPPVVSQPSVPSLATAPGVLKLAINQLNEQTAEQVCDFLLNSGDDSGVVLHLTDIVGETLISPDRGCLVIKDTFIAHLRRHNLLCQE